MLSASKKTTILIAITAIASSATVCSGFSAFADVVVICNPSLALTDADIKDVFSGEKQIAGSTKILPVDNKASVEEFVSKVLGLNKAKYDAQWAKRAFRDGISTPTSQTSDGDVVSFVKNTPGGVGYVGSAPGDGVKVLKKY